MSEEERYGRLVNGSELRRVEIISRATAAEYRVYSEAT